MTAAETLEYAQSSVDQIERGIGFVQDRLAQAEGLAVKVDDLAVTASDVAAKARRGSRYALVAAGVVVLGIVVIVAIRKCPTRRHDEETPETTT